MSEVKEQFYKVLGGLVAAIGTTGALVVVGSAVLWIRFTEVDLPGIQAVTVQPRQEALVQGAQVTIVFGLIALAAVLLMLFANLKDPTQIDWRSKLILGLLVIGAIVYVALTKLPCWPTVGLAALAVVLGLGCLAVGNNQGQAFWAFGLAVFVSSLVFSSATGFLIADQQKFVQGVAIVRGEKDAGLTGVYVAATDGAIYLGKPTVAGDEGEKKLSLFEVPTGDEVTYAVGPLEAQPEAEERAEKMLEQLIENRESKVSGAPDGQGTAPSPTSDPVARVASAFNHKIFVRRKVRGPLCLVRYADSSKSPRGRWWTSCREARGLRTIGAVRQKLALPSRFQPVYDMWVRGKVPSGTRLLVLIGRAAPQCERAKPKSCRHLYAGGGRQYYIADQGAVKIVATRCAASREDRPARWRSCKK